MNPFNRNGGNGPRAFPSRNDGDRTARLLALMIGDYYVEATRWRSRADDIRLAADVLWDIRDRLITDEISVEDAEVWLDQGFAYLDGLMRERARRNHPAMRGTR